MKNKKSLLIREFMDRNKVLIAYVRDPYGFRKGVVVAFMKDVTDKTLPTEESPVAKELRLGWSLVNHTMDIDYKYLRPDQLPIMQRMETMFEKGLEGTMEFNRIAGKADAAYEKLIRHRLSARVPLFDRNEALLRALDRALDNEEVNIIEVGEFDILGDTPLDKDVLKAIRDTYMRARKYFKLDEPVVESGEATVQ